MEGGHCEWVVVDCPHCGNINRTARRQCEECNHTGKVMKSIPVSNYKEKGVCDESPFV